MNSCAACGGGSVRYGTKERRMLDISGGHAVLGTVRVQRWRCTACGILSTELPGEAMPRSLATAAARDAVAEACFEAGYAPAAARFGIDEKTARSFWSAWAALRESGLPQRPPEFMGLHLGRVAGTERTLVTDVQHQAVVDILPGTGFADVGAWLEKASGAGRIDSVAIGLHPPFREAVLQHAPGTRIMVCPAHARAHGIRAFLAGFRTASRWLYRPQGSNVREQPRQFAAPVQSLSQGQREDMAAWDGTILALHAAKERFLEALAAARAREAAIILADAHAMCLAVRGGAGPAAFLESWRSEICMGTGEGSLEPFAPVLDRMAGLWAGRRPPLPFDLARGLAVLQDGPRVTMADPEEGHDIILGVPMADLVGMLQAQGAAKGPGPGGRMQG